VSTYLFPDNTVLCNFVSVGQLPLLARLLDGNGRWVEAVAHECDKSSAVYPDLKQIADDGWLSDPLEISDEIEQRQVEGIRRAVFGGTAALATQHLGEAQTIHVIARWADYAGSTWISDDQESLRVARLQGIPVRETQHLVAEAVQWGFIRTPGDGFAMLEQMVAEGRNPALPRTAADLMTM
jgi:hypothetical protein